MDKENNQKTQQRRD